MEQRLCVKVVADLKNWQQIKEENSISFRPLTMTIKINQIKADNKILQKYFLRPHILPIKVSHPVEDEGGHIGAG